VENNPILEEGAEQKGREAGTLDVPFGPLVLDGKGDHSGRASEFLQGPGGPEPWGLNLRMDAGPGEKVLKGPQLVENRRFHFIRIDESGRVKPRRLTAGMLELHIGQEKDGKLDGRRREKEKDRNGKDEFG
jgi:hypothetical protein